MSSTPDRHLRVLYVVYWSLLEPLGRSLVLPTLLRLADRGVALTLLSFEKPAAEADVQRVRQMLGERGIGWTALRYHKRPRVPATAFDIVSGWMGGLRLHRRSPFDLVHARTFVGGLCGSGIARLTHTALIYHNEGFYPDEQVDSGVWRAGSAPHRVARWLERRLYVSASGVVTLSRKAETAVRGLPGVGDSGKPVVVVPSCVDLARFAPAGPRQPPGDRPLRLVYSGSLGGRYLFDDIARFFAVLLRDRPGSRLTVLSWADPAGIQRSLRAVGVPDGSWDLRWAAHDEMPRELAAHDVGLHFAAAATGGAGGSPTKIGEYWACGLPVVVTSGLGDIGEFVSAEGTGVVVDDLSDAGLLRSLPPLYRLLADPELAGRCRAAAERHYGLDAGCDTQVALYGTALGQVR